MRVIVMLLLCISLFSCSQLYFNDGYTKVDFLVPTLLKNYTRKISERYPIVLVSTGGRMGEYLEKVSPMLYCYADYNLVEARRLYIDLVETLVHDIQLDEQLRLCFKENSISYLATGIKLGFMNVSNRFVTGKGIASIQMTKGIISYSVSPDGKSLKNVHRETYEEALAIVQKNS